MRGNLKRGCGYCKSSDLDSLLKVYVIFQFLIKREEQNEGVGHLHLHVWDFTVFVSLKHCK